MSLKQTIAGIIVFLFLTPILSYGPGNGLIASVLHPNSTPAYITANKLSIISGAVLLLINACAIGFIGITLLPLLQPKDKRIAYSYLIFRIAMAAFLFLVLLALFALSSTSKLFLGASSKAVYPEILCLFSKASIGLYLLSTILLGCSSLLFCHLLYKSKILHPVVLLLGPVGYLLLTAGALLELLGYPLALAMSIPGAVFEFVLGIWLVVRGFNLSAVLLQQEDDM